MLSDKDRLFCLFIVFYMENNLAEQEVQSLIKILQLIFCFYFPGIKLWFFSTTLNVYPQFQSR
jgi:hypothetical protein